MEKCSSLINYGMLLRIVYTIISYSMLFYYYKLKVPLDPKGNILYLILPVLLTGLDEVDNIWTIFYKYKDRLNGCTHLFDYQYKDKIIDSLSYLYLYAYFNLGLLFLIFTVYRIIGVILFTLTKNSLWLVLFFDFSKEILLYQYFFGNNYTYLIPCVLLKIVFEYYFHTIHLDQNY
jgi:hypothetical protein